MNPKNTEKNVVNCKPLVSIIIPAKNAQLTILQTIDSIINQNYKCIEVLVIDDSSTDSTIKVAYSRHDHRIKVIEGGGLGVSHARNIGIINACGKYIMFVDADDSIEQNTINDGVRIALKDNADIVIGGMLKKFPNGTSEQYTLSNSEPAVFDNNEICGLVESAIGYNSPSDSRLNNCLLSGIWGKLYKAELLNASSFAETITTGEDTLFNVKSFLKATRIVVTPTIWYNYYQHDQSAVNRYRPDAFKESMDMILELKSMLNGRFVPSFMRRVLFQFEGALMLAITRNDAVPKLSQKAKLLKLYMLQFGWDKELCEIELSGIGLTLKHRLFLIAARLNFYRVMCAMSSYKYKSMQN